MKRKTMTVEQWIKLIEEFESSGMEQRAFAEKAGTNYSALKYWLYKIRRQKTGTQIRAAQLRPPLSFVEVKAQPARTGGRIEIDLPSGLRVRFDASTDAMVIGEVTQALTRC